MITVGLTGSIGSGKSTVAHLLAERGARVLDADDITHDLQQPGKSVHRRTVARFGPDVVAPDGSLDRAALAALVFADPVALADLEALTHPAVHAAMAAQTDALAVAGAAVVVLVVPLLLEVAQYEVAGVVVVDCPVETVVRRLVDGRGMTEGEVRARLARQMGREARRARADHVIDNSGPAAALPAQVERAWAWILDLDASPSARPGSHSGDYPGEGVSPPR